MLTYNHKNLNNAKNLRKNMTKEERKLWFDFLCKLPIKIYKQKLIGNYIVDFYCPKYKLAIELDGSQHYENAEEQKDKQRTEYLKSLGISVKRYTNLEILNSFESVCDDIYNHIMK